MGNKPFMRPVFLRLQHDQTGNYQANNASDAIEYLEHFWPSSKSGEYRRAKAICRSALDDLASADSARNYLIVAAERAGILDRIQKTRLTGAGRSHGRGIQSAVAALPAAT